MNTAFLRRCAPLLLCAALFSAPAAMAAPAPTSAELDAVVAQFKSHGLTPAGKNGFLQPVRWVEQSLVAERSSIALTTKDGREALRPGQDLVFDLNLPLPGRVETPMVFIGYGLHGRSGKNYIANVDLRGKVLVMIQPGGASADEARAQQEETRAAFEHAGALGVITILARGADAAQEPTGFYLDAKAVEGANAAFAATVRAENANVLFDKSGHSFAQIEAAAVNGEALPSFQLNKGLTADLKTKRRTVEDMAVLATLPGSDPSLAREYVVVTAQLSSSASLSGIERALADGVSPRRTTLFAVVREPGRGAAAARAVVAETARKAGVVAVLSIGDVGADRILVRGMEDSSIGMAARDLAATGGVLTTLRPLTVMDRLPASATAPQLGLSRPSEAGASFDGYTALLVKRIGDSPDRPRWTPTSRFAPPQLDAEYTRPLRMPLSRHSERDERGAA